MAVTNPYLAEMGGAITNQVTNNLQRNVLPGINRGSIAAGGYGGSRQGIAQGLAIGETNQGLSNSLSNMYGQAYESDANRRNQMEMQQAQLASQQQIASMQDSTNRYGLGNQFTLGQGQNQNTRFGLENQYSLGREQNQNTATANQNQYSLGLGQNQNTADSNQYNFYTNNRNLDQQGARDGFNMYRDSYNMDLGRGTGLYDTGKSEYDAGEGAFGRYGDNVYRFSGLGGSSSQTNPSTGGGMAGAVGGALTMAQIWALLNQNGTASSDIRLKTNLQFLGRTPRGNNVWSWDWKRGGSSIGVIAQEMMLTDPSAVSVGSDGFMMVDYAKV